MMTTSNEDSVRGVKFPYMKEMKRIYTAVYEDNKELILMEFRDDNKTYTLGTTVCLDCMQLNFIEQAECTIEQYAKSIVNINEAKYTKLLFDLSVVPAAAVAKAIQKHTKSFQFIFDLEEWKEICKDDERYNTQSWEFGI